MSTKQQLWKQNDCLIDVYNYLRQKDISISNLKIKKCRTIIIKQFKNYKLDHKVLKRFVREYQLLNEEKKIKVNNTEYLISGYNRKLSDRFIFNINSLIYTYYKDNFKLISSPQSVAVVIYEKGQKAVIETNGREIFEPCFVYWNCSMDTNMCNKLVIKFRWYADRGMEGIIFGYFFGNVEALVSIRRVGWNKCFTKPTTYYEPIIVKGFRNDEAIRYINNGEEKIGIPLNIVTPVMLSESIWTVEYDFKSKNIQIRYKGVKLISLELVHDRYILPIFGLLSEKGGDYIEIIDSYTL